MATSTILRIAAARQVIAIPKLNESKASRFQWTLLNFPEWKIRIRLVITRWWAVHFQKFLVLPRFKSQLARRPLRPKMVLSILALANAPLKTRMNHTHL